MIICPNLHNPSVLEEFNELVNAVGEKAAYHIWSSNNGNSVDKAPNGASSILFNSLLKQAHGDRKTAIKMKAKTYQKDFIKWFGDWPNNASEASKAVDLNGEPLLLWQEKNNDSENKTISFTNNQEKAVKTDNDVAFPIYLNTQEKASITDNASTYIVADTKEVRSIVTNDFSSDKGNEEGNKIIEGIRLAKTKTAETKKSEHLKNTPSLSKSAQEFIKQQYLTIKFETALLDGPFESAPAKLMRGETITSGDLIQWFISNHAFSEKLLPLANVLQRHSIPIKLIQSERGSVAEAITNTDTFDTIIGINQNLIGRVSNGFLARVLLHETMHAVTSEIITKPKNDAQESLKKLNSSLHNIFDTFFDSKKFDRYDSSGLYYGLLDEDEFIAEFMTNKDFRELIYATAATIDHQRNSKNLIGLLKNYVNKISKALINRELFNGTTESQIKEYAKELKQYLLNIPTISAKYDVEAAYEAVYSKINPILYANEQSIDTVKQLDRQLQSFERHNYIETELLKSTSNKPDTAEEAKKKLDNLALTIARGLSQRLKAVTVSKMAEDSKTRIQKELNLQISQFEQGQSQMYRSLITSLSQILPQLLEDSIEISRLSKNNATLVASELQYQIHDNFGLYDSILSNITKTLESASVIDQLEKQRKNNSVVDDAVFGDINELIKLVNKCQQICTTARASLDNILVNTSRDILVDAGNNTHSITMGEYLNSLKQIGFDTAVFYKYGGMSDKVKDDGIRSIAYLINKALNNAEKLSVKRNTELLEAQAALTLTESALDLYEKDENGKTTQYLVRDLNYGKFRNNYHKFLKKLNADIAKKYGILLEPLNNQAPDEDPEAMVEWNDKLNEWLNKNCERPYKKKFYEAYSKLSSDTKYEWGQLSKQIRALKMKVLGKDGYYHYELLNNSDRALLERLNVEKRMMLSDRDYQGNLKTGDELRKAQELQQLHEDLYGNKDKRKIKRDFNAWITARNKMIEECGGSKEFQKYINGEPNTFDFKRFKLWDSINSKRVLKQDDDGNVLLFKQIEEEAGKIIYEVDGDGGAKYEEVKNQINNILKIYRNFQTGDIAYETIPKGERIRLNKLLSLQTRLRKKAMSQNKAVKKAVITRSKLFNKYTTTEFTEYYKKARAQAAEMELESPGTYDDFIMSTSTYRFDYLTGEEVPETIRWFTKLVAKPEYADQFMETIPGDGWIEHSENELANDKYDHNNKSFLQPKRYEEDENGRPIKNKPLYDNTKAFNKIQKSKNLKRLYDLVLETNRDINRLYGRENFDEYLLPGITGSLFKYMKGRGSVATGALQYAKDELGIGEQGIQQDPEFRQTAERILNNTDDFGDMINNRNISISDGTRPDGSELNMIPRHYTSILDDPSQLSSDLVGMMAQAYKSAADYHFKSEVKDECETLADMMKRRDVYKRKGLKFWEYKRIPGQDSNTYHIAKKFLEMNLYNIKSSDYSTAIPWFNGKKLTTIHWNKMGKLAKLAVTAINLGCNITVAAVGYLTGMTAHIINALTGQKYNLADATKAAGIVTWHFAKNLFGARYIANRLSNDKLMLICEYFNVAGQGERKAEHSNRLRLINAVNDNLVYGMLSGSDFMVKSQIAVSVLLSYRYYKGAFYTKEDLDINLMNVSKEERKKAFKEWRKGKTAYDILSAKKRYLEVDSDYANAFEAIENVLRNRIIKYSESADGMMTETQKAQITTTFLGSMALIHRQYLPLMGQERFGSTIYDMDIQQMTGGIFRSGIKGLYWLTSALAKFLYGSVRNMSVKHGYLNAKEYYDSRFKDKTSIQSYMTGKYINMAMKQMIIEITIGNIIAYLAGSIYHNVKAESDKDKRRKLALLAYIMHRWQWEAMTPYRTDDLLSNIKSPSAATGTMDRIENFAETFSRTYYPSVASSLWDTFNNKKSGKKFNPEVTRGEYAGWKKWQRSLFKLLPQHNFYEQWYGSEAKDRYFVNQIMKQND